MFDRMIGTIMRSFNASKKKKVHRVRPEIADTWMLHHDTAISVNKFLTKKGIPVVLQPPYLPDLSLYDFFLLPRLKFDPKGCHLGTVNNIQKVVTEQLRALPHEDFQHCYQEMDQCLWRCVASQVNNFEGDNVDL